MLLSAEATQQILNYYFYKGNNITGEKSLFIFHVCDTTNSHLINADFHNWSSWCSAVVFIIVFLKKGNTQMGHKSYKATARWEQNTLNAIMIISTVLVLIC